MKNKPNELIQFKIPDEKEITENGQRLLLEVTVKSNGIWRIHKNDPDKVFPSDFHADRVDKPEKLDIYTGEVYDKKTKKKIYTLSSKVMKYIHLQLEKSKENEILSKFASIKI